MHPEMWPQTDQRVEAMKLGPECSRKVSREQKLENVQEMHLGCVRN